MSRTYRLTLLALAAGVLVVAFLALDPIDDPPPRTTAAVATGGGEPSSGKGADHGGHAGGHAPGRPADVADFVQQPSRSERAAAPDDGPLIRTRASRPVGGVTVLRAERGDTLRFAVASDTTDEVHVHGYDLVRTAGPGRPARFAFPARLEGIFEVELEGARTEIARLVVDPR